MPATFFSSPASCWFNEHDPDDYDYEDDQSEVKAFTIKSANNNSYVFENSVVLCVRLACFMWNQVLVV